MPTRETRPERDVLEAQSPYEEMLCDSVAGALDELPQRVGIHARVEAVRLGTLGRVSGADVCGRGERIAGGLARFSGRLEQVGLFAMETEDAFEMIRDREASKDPLGAYTHLGREIVRAVTAAIDPTGGDQQGDATLQEDSAIRALLHTHAPSDTVVVSVSLALPGNRDEDSLAAHVYVLAEPKLFDALRSELLVDRLNRVTLPGF